MDQRCVVAAAAVSDHAVSVDWSDGHSAAFDNVWLRDNCRCSQCYHPDTRERLVDAMVLPLDVAPAVAEAADGSLELVWPDGHESVLSGAFLRGHCYCAECRTDRVDKPRLWRGAELVGDLPDYDYGDAVGSDSGLAALLGLLWTTGLVIVRDTPDSHDALARLCHRISWMRETNFGVDFDVVSKVEPNNVAYTSIELAHHTDLPNREMPPGVQFLHCRRSDAPGGASTLVDGFCAAQTLSQREPDAHELLTTVEIPYVFHDADYDIRWNAPVIGTSAAGEYRDIRYHNALMAPLGVEADLVVPVYQALQAFTAVLREPGMELEHRMEPGDMIVFNNRRVLHGRKAFDEGGGARRLHGAYIDLDELRSKMRVLDR